MSDEFHDFGMPDFFEPEAIGRPGNRRFRVIAQKSGRTASLWLEREDLQALSTAIQQVVSELRGSDVLRVEGSETATTAPEPRAGFPDEPDVEFTVGRWALGYDEENSTIVFLAASIDTVETVEPAEDETIDPQFRISLSTDEAEQFAHVAESVVAAGRPRCPLCGRALNAPDEPHGCVKQNGHRHLE